MIHATFKRPESSTEVLFEDFLTTTRIEAARAFRVLRDSRRFDLAGEMDFIVRAPGDELLVRLGHPGLWSVTLEPKVGVFDLTGRLLRGERAAVAPIEEYLDFFQRRPDVRVLARFSAPHLDAWARGGDDFPFIHMPLVRASLRQGVKVYERGSAVAALEAALNANYAGVTHLRGGAVVAGEGDLTALAELILLIEQAAHVELLSEIRTRSAPGRRREEETAPSWA